MRRDLDEQLAARAFVEYMGLSGFLILLLVPVLVFTALAGWVWIAWPLAAVVLSLAIFGGIGKEPK